MFIYYKNYLTRRFLKLNLKEKIFSKELEIINYFKGIKINSYISHILIMGQDIVNSKIITNEFKTIYALMQIYQLLQMVWNINESVVEFKSPFNKVLKDFMKF